MDQQNNTHHQPLSVLFLGALGIVYGDIGTSPLYAIRECFSAHYLTVDETNVLGILSLIFWSLFLVVSIKYVSVILRADNRGEGGILSLMSLALKKTSPDKKYFPFIVPLGIIGAALLYGDGVITPAISVLSAVEGVKVVTPVFEKYVVPVTMVIIVLLFMVQQIGTGRIGVLFGPIILLWFIVIGWLGVQQIILKPDVMLSLNPMYAVDFFISNGSLGFIILGSVVLVITGGEALYADMGHFGKEPIRLAWFFIVLPGLVLNYLGQGALLLTNPAAIKSPFFLMAPEWMLWPLVILATLATVIASQALISGVFSLSKQAMQLGFSPRMRIIHTSSREIGQIYIPVINWIMMVFVLWLVMTFKTSSQLASAYGIAVTGTMAITSLLAFIVAREHWKWGFKRSLFIFIGFFILDLAFFGANILKIGEGGWISIALGLGAYLIMSTWKKGRRILAEKLLNRSVSIDDFLQQIKENPVHRVPGSAIYMAGDSWGVPFPLLHIIKHNKVMHNQVAILTIKTKEVPWVAKKDRVQIETLSENFYRIIAYYGFMEIPKIKHILEACRERGIMYNITETTFVLGRETILATGDPTLSIWRERIFAFLSRNAERPTSFFKIPPNQVIEVGIQVEI